MVRIMGMGTSDVCQAIELWSGIAELNYPIKFDTVERISSFVNRNPGISTIAKLEEAVIGAVLCGHDGRRGFIYHMGVDDNYRKQGIARKMIERCFQQLKNEGIDTCFLFTAESNIAAQEFWKSMGFNYAPHIMYHSRSI